MRYFLLVVLGGLVAGLPGAVAPESSEGHYTGTLGAGVTGQFDLGFYWCITKAIDPELGCIGGDALSSPSGDRYLRVQVTFTDAVTGPNVYGWACLKEPDENGVRLCSAGEDPIGQACGTSFEVDATGFHDGSTSIGVVIHTLQVDPATNAVCLGTAGTINVVWIE